MAGISRVAFQSSLPYSPYIRQNPQCRTIQCSTIAPTRFSACRAVASYLIFDAVQKGRSVRFCYPVLIANFTRATSLYSPYSATTCYTGRLTAGYEARFAYSFIPQTPCFCLPRDLIVKSMRIRRSVCRARRAVVIVRRFRRSRIRSAVTFAVQ